jgi:hypothetical protein
MDLDVALLMLGSPSRSAMTWDDDREQALAALQVLVQRARAYVKSPDSQRLALLASVLQEPVKDPKPVDTETVVQAWLTANDLVTITRRAAQQLGILPLP